jgi:endonuclease G
MARNRTQPADKDDADLLKLIEAATARIDGAARGRNRADGREASFDVGNEDSHAERLASNPPDAVRRRLQRRGISSAAFSSDATGRNEDFAVIGDDGPTPETLERIIGKDMLMEINYLDGGHLTAKSIARVVIRKSSGQIRGFGSGVLVSPHLFLTNNHVLGSADAARTSTLEFNYQKNLAGTLQTPTVFRLDPDAFFVTSPADELDFTIVAVSEASETGTSTLEFGHKPLTAITDEILAGECVTIIQHPKGDPKQIALRENEVLFLPGNAEAFLHYQTDTHPGSSGSPVFNDEWDIVALHHSGKPRTNGSGQTLARDGSVWSPAMGQDAIDWVANEGIRVAAIVRFLREREATMTAAQKQLLEQALRGATPSEAAPAKEKPVRPSVDRGPSVHTAMPDQAATIADGCVSIVVPLHVTVRLGQPSLPIAAAATAPLIGEEAVTIDPNYEDRIGYDENFLGKTVPLPILTAAQRQSAAKNRRAVAGDPEYLLRYHHFSIVMHAKRRLAYFTAVNIDGESHFRGEMKREKDKWFFDPRLDRAEQVGNELYARNPFDRGHLVRRLDPAWGANSKIAKVANDDTFHFTNCSPQHSQFNQGKNLWAGVEDFLLNKAAEESRRISVFSGAVFRRDDPLYREIRVPREFWKVAVLVKPNGKLSATGYVLTQAELIEDVVAAEEISPAAVARMFQVRVDAIEALVEFDFGQLRKFDPAGPLESFEATGRQEIENYSEIVL